MKKVLIIIIVIALKSSFLLSQVTFEKTYGNELNEYHEYGVSVQQTSDNGYIITGYSQHQVTLNRNALMVKTDAYGNLIWKKHYDNSQNTRGNCVQETTDGGFISVGYIENPFSDSSNVYVTKLDNMGDTLWTKIFSNDIKDRGMSIRQTIEGGYIITGFTCDSMWYDCDVYLIKINSIGEMEWYKTIGGLERDQAYCIEQTSDNGFIIIGSTFSFGNGGRDIYLIKTNENGDTSFTKTYGGFNTDNAYSIKQTSDGGYILVGETISFDQGQNYYDVYLIKTDEVGDTLWTKRYGGEQWEVGRSIDLTDDGGYIITGHTESYGGSTGNVLVMKTDCSGDTLWTQTFGGNGFDWGNSVQQTSDGGFIIAGYSSSFGNNNIDMYLIKINGQGTLDIHRNPTTDEFGVFPNPANNILHIKTCDNTKIEIINLTGRVIYNTNVNCKTDLFSIDISGYSKGLYLVKLVSEKNSTIEKIIIK